MNKEKEIRKLIGDRYHLYVGYSPDKTEWKLFKKYENGDSIYYSDDNKAIMTSETHTEEDLYKFAKSHHKIDFYKSNCKLRNVLLAMVVIISITNIFIGLRTLNIIVLTADFILLTQMTCDYFIWDKNWKVDMLELKENFERLREKTKNKKS